MKTISRNDFVLAVTMVVFAVVSRWLPHPPNVAPIATIALMSMVYLDKRLAVAVPLLSMFFSDLVIGFYGVQMVFVYGSYVLIGGLGLWARRAPRWWKLVGSSLIGSTLFFVITNYAVWQFGSMYTKDMAGLIECYAMAVPFFRNTLFGDLFYVGVFAALIAVVHRVRFDSLLSHSAKNDMVIDDAH